MSELVILLTAAVLTWCMRASFMVFGARQVIGGGVERGLRHARSAALAAIIATALVDTGEAGGAMVLASVAASCAVAVVAWRTRRMLLSVATGVATLWLVTLAGA